MKRRDVLIAAGGLGAVSMINAPRLWAATSTDSTISSPTLVLWREGQKGQRLEVRGRVADSLHKPIEGAQVGVRHCDLDGNYSGAYEGVMSTNKRGEYILRTAMPGTYGRPRHIHVTVSHPQSGYEYTEIVFRGDEMLDEESQKNGIVLETVRLNDTEVLVGNFDIVLEG